MFEFENQHIRTTSHTVPMIPAFQPMGSARWMTIGLCIMLGGCSSIGDSAPEAVSAPEAASQAAPDISKAIPVVKTAAGQYHLTPPLEVAGPIEAPIGSMNPWVICLRSVAESRFTVALFYKADTLASSHISTIADHCDRQTYRPLPG